MSDRMAGQSVIEKLLAEQDISPRRPRLASFFGASPIRPANLSWHTGAVGERIVAELLERLPKSWRVFHSIPIGRESTDIDHILVGPAGVFTINTKHHAGKTIWVADRRLMVGGIWEPKYIASAESEARCLTTTLSGRMVTDPTVRPIIAFVGAKKLTVKEAPATVAVLEATALVRWLSRQPETLDEHTRERIARIIDDPSTWRVEAEADRASLLRRFTELSILNRQARLIQSLWGLVGLVVGIGAAYELATAIVHMM